MKTITISGNVIPAKEFDFNTVCDLADMGCDIMEGNMFEKPMSLCRAYLAVCMGTNAELAGKVLQEHIINGGNVSEIITTIQSMVEESDFFQALRARTEKEEAEIQPEATKKTATRKK